MDFGVTVYYAENLRRQGDCRKLKVTKHEDLFIYFFHLHVVTGKHFNMGISNDSHLDIKSAFMFVSAV